MSGFSNVERATRSSSFVEVDVTEWSPGGDEYLGTKPKRWLIDPDGEWWLFKQATVNRRQRADPPSGGHGMSAWEWWVGFMVLDALIGNTDRHQSNWGVIGDRTRRLAPTFDHASSLGFQLDDATRIERLTTCDRNRTVAAYARRAKSRFESSPHPCDVAACGLQMVRSEVRRMWLDRGAEVGDVRDVLASVPAHRATEPAREFATELVAANRTRLLSLALGTLGS